MVLHSTWSLHECLELSQNRWTLKRAEEEGKAARSRGAAAQAKEEAAEEEGKAARSRGAAAQAKEEAAEDLILQAQVLASEKRPGTEEAAELAAAG
jgi:uncharacterized protein YdaU (DUF1376 family)